MERPHHVQWMNHTPTLEAMVQTCDSISNKPQNPPSNRRRAIQRSPQLQAKLAVVVFLMMISRFDQGFGARTAYYTLQAETRAGIESQVTDLLSGQCAG